MHAIAPKTAAATPGAVSDQEAGVCGGMRAHTNTHTQTHTRARTYRNHKRELPGTRFME